MCLMSGGSSLEQGEDDDASGERLPVQVYDGGCGRCWGDGRDGNATTETPIDVQCDAAQTRPRGLMEECSDVPIVGDKQLNVSPTATAHERWDTATQDARRQAGLVRRDRKSVSFLTKVVCGATRCSIDRRPGISCVTWRMDLNGDDRLDATRCEEVQKGLA